MRVVNTLFRHLNIPLQCRELGVGLWSCPPFLFLIMGLVNIGVTVSTYYLAEQYASPEFVILIVVGLSVFLLVTSFTIIHAFEQVIHARQSEAAKHRELVHMKDEFVFIAAHELRTPANAIRWALENLERKEPEFFKKEHDVFSALTVSSARLLDLVKDLLEVSRIETSSIMLHLVPAPLDRIVGRSLTGLSPYAEQSKVSLRNTVSADLPLVFVDEARLKEVLDNLVTNAIKYNREQGAVTVSAERSEGGVLLHVTDEGKGILPEDVPHVFEKFWRSVDSHAIEGTGLGLFIVKKLVDLMRGRVTFATNVGSGTTFSVFLPQVM